MPLKLTRRDWTPFLVMRGTVRRKRIEESTGTNDQTAAEEIRAKREAELLAESIWGRAATSTFAHAAVSYMEKGGDKRFLQPAIKYFATTSLAKIGQDEIDRGARKVYPKASPATLNRQWYTPISAVMTHAAEQGWCSKPLLRRPKIPKQGEPTWLTPEQAERLIEACGKHLRPLVIFLLYTGARTGEALWLDWRYVDLGRAHVTFAKTKNGDPRGVPLHPRVVAELANLSHRDGEIFRRPDGLPYERPDDDDNKDTSAGTRIKTAFNGACRRAGIVDFTPHCCRHTWATWVYQAKRDLGALQKLGGWKSIKMVMRYAHTNVDELAHAIEALPIGNSQTVADKPAHTTTAPFGGILGGGQTAQEKIG